MGGAGSGTDAMADGGVDAGTLSAAAFVDRVAERLAAEGWTTERHELSYGTVVEATRGGRTRLTVAVPDGDATVPAELVERLVELRERVGADAVALTTRGSYTDGARERAAEADVELLDPGAAVGAGADTGADPGAETPPLGERLPDLPTPGSLTGTGESEDGSEAESEAGGAAPGLPVSRRAALVAGGGVVVAAGAGVAATDTLGGLLGGSDRPVYPGAEPVDLPAAAVERVRSSEDLRFERPDDAGVAVYTVGDGVETVRQWYRSHASVNGWERALATAGAFVYRRDGRGAVVVPQERNAAIDTGLPVAGDRPTDIVVLEMEWGYLAPVADGLPVYPGAAYAELSAEAAERVRTTEVLAFDRPDDTTVMVYAAAEATVSEVRAWYAGEARAATGGWERQVTTDRGAVYRKGDRGLVALVQQRNALVDTGLPVEGEPPTDTLALEMAWNALSEVA